MQIASFRLDYLNSAGWNAVFIATTATAAASGMKFHYYTFLVWLLSFSFRVPTNVFGEVNINKTPTQSSKHSTVSILEAKKKCGQHIERECSAVKKKVTS